MKKVNIYLLIENICQICEKSILLNGECWLIEKIIGVILGFFLSILVITTIFFFCKNVCKNIDCKANQQSTIEVNKISIYTKTNTSIKLDPETGIN